MSVSERKASRASVTLKQMRGIIDLVKFTREVRTGTSADLDALKRNISELGSLSGIYEDILALSLHATPDSGRPKWAQATANCVKEALARGNEAYSRFRSVTAALAEEWEGMRRAGATQPRHIKAVTAAVALEIGLSILAEIPFEDCDVDGFKLRKLAETARSLGVKPLASPAGKRQ